jgi:hypothetical protein
MPALVCVPPQQFRKILEAEGFKVAAEDDFNWIFVRGAEEVPVVLPKRGQYVSVDATMNMVLVAPKIGQQRYLDLVHETGGLPGLPEIPEPDPS